MKKTGIELIAQERAEQIEKHGYTLTHDNKINTDCELQSAVLWLLTGNPENYPKNWDNSLWNKMQGASYIKKFITAAALLAAEIDRLREFDDNTAEAINDHAAHDSAAGLIDEPDSDNEKEVDTIEQAAEKEFPLINGDDDLGNYVVYSQRHGFYKGANHIKQTHVPIASAITLIENYKSDIIDGQPQGYTTKEYLDIIVRGIKNLIK